MDNYSFTPPVRPLWADPYSADLRRITTDDQWILTLAENMIIHRDLRPSQAFVAAREFVTVWNERLEQMKTKYIAYEVALGCSPSTTEPAPAN